MSDDLRRGTELDRLIHEPARLLWCVLTNLLIDSFLGFLEFQIKACKKPFRIRHVADEPPEWQGEFLDERWGGNNLVPFSNRHLSFRCS